MSMLTHNRGDDSRTLSTGTGPGSMALPARCLRTLAGAPAGAQMATRRHGSFLVLVVGTLALLAVITIVYVALGNQDTRTKAAVVRREQLDDVPAKVAEYHADILSRDVFSMTLDGTVRQRFDVTGGTLTETDVVEATPVREVDDAPGVAHNPNDPAIDARLQLTSDRRNAVGATGNALVEEGVQLFTPWGGLDDTLSQALLNYAPGSQGELLRVALAPSGALARTRLPSSDPFLASYRPTFLNAQAALASNPTAADFATNIDFPYLDQRDWYSISNLAPEGMFVNLWNLRNNFDAPSDAEPASATRGVGMGFGKSLLEPLGGNQFQAEQTLVTDWGFDLSSVPERDYLPFYWTMRQHLAFRPARVSVDSAALESEDPRSPFFKGYQWADADGDGMLDSRYYELARAVALPGDVPLPEFAGNVRWFIASRVVDLTGLVNVNYAGDLATSPAERVRLAPTAGATIVAQPNFVLPLGLSPGDIDLRRLLMQVDAFATSDHDLSGTNLSAYDGINYSGAGSLPLDDNALAYDEATEERMMLAGSAAYANLRFANATGVVVGLDAIDSSTGTVVTGLLDDQAAPNANARPWYSIVTQLVDDGRDFAGSPPLRSDPFGTQGWLTGNYPTRGFGAVPGFYTTPYGVVDVNGVQTHQGWVSWPARRTISYLAQVRKASSSVDVLDSTRAGGLRFGISDLQELLESRTINNSSVTSPLEVALGARDITPEVNDPITPENRPRIDVLRSNRSSALERQTYDPVVDAVAGVANSGGENANNLPMRKTLRRLATDVRQYLTTVSGARPLRRVTSVVRQLPGAGAVGVLPVSDRTLSAGEIKLNARSILDLAPRAAGPQAGKPPAVLAAESAAGELFRGYAAALAPYASLNDAWDATGTLGEQYRTLFYGYRGPQLALLTAGTMAVNMVDLADGPIVMPLQSGPTGYDRGIAGSVAPQLQAIRPGVSDVRDKPTIKTLVFTEVGVSTSVSAGGVAVSEDSAVVAPLNTALDANPPLLGNGAINASGLNGQLALAFPFWSTRTDLDADPRTAAPDALVAPSPDNLDLTGTGALSPDPSLNPLVQAAPAVNVIGIEPQPFVTQVTTMTVYMDNFSDGDGTGYNDLPNSGANTLIKFTEPEVVDPSRPIANRNEIYDGATTNNTEVLFRVVAFKLTNPFDRTIVLGSPMLSDALPNTHPDVTPGAGFVRERDPDYPIQLVPDVASQNREAEFPVRPDGLGFFSRDRSWSVGRVIAGVEASNQLQPVLNLADIEGGFGRGDQINVNSRAFLDGGLAVDHISDFHYVRFGDRTYMLMSLNEQAKMDTSSPGAQRPATQDFIFARPDATLALNADAAAPIGGYANQAPPSPPPPPVVPPITLNPIVIGPGQTVVAYALSEAPYRILDRLRNVPSAWGLDSAIVPNIPDDPNTGLGDGLDAGAGSVGYLGLSTFMHRIIERQIAGGYSSEGSASFARTIFNPHGAYWVPMIWTGDTATVPQGFTNSRLQDLQAYVNPIPRAAGTAGLDVNNSGAVEPNEQLAQRTVSLWRTVRAPVAPDEHTSASTPAESRWFRYATATADGTDVDWTGSAAPVAYPPPYPAPTTRRSFPSSVLGSNDYRNDQLVDRLRIPTRLDMSVALDWGDPVTGRPANPLVIDGSDTTEPPPAAPRNLQREGATLVLWSSVRRPSDPRAAASILPAGSPAYLYNLPRDVLPGYCLEAKYWEDPGTSPDTVRSWNIAVDSPIWSGYKAERSTSTTVNFDFSLFQAPLLPPTSEWNGAALTLFEGLGRLHGYELGTTTQISFRLGATARAIGATAGGLSTLNAPPNLIEPRGYNSALPGLRTFAGSIDQKPNATVTAFANAASVPVDVNAFDATSILVTGRLSYADMPVHLSHDADPERGNASSNFYRDVDMRRGAGGNPAATGPDVIFNQEDHAYRWLSTLRSADLLRPLGVGPFEAPVRLQGTTLASRAGFAPVALAGTGVQTPDQENNTRYTTLSEALAAALGYENRPGTPTFAPIHAPAAREDLNLLRSPYRNLALAEPGSFPTLLKPPPGAMVPGAGAGGAVVGDDSALTLLFDRGNVWLDRFVPFIDDNATDLVLDRSQGEAVVGAGLPPAQSVLEQFETPAADPAALDASDTIANPLTTMRPGVINVNTAPIEVMRVLPGMSPRPMIVPESPLAPSAAPTLRPSTADIANAASLGDYDWINAVVSATNAPQRPALPINQNHDIAAGIVAYRDMTPVLLNRSAVEAETTLAGASPPPRGAGRVTDEAIAVPMSIPGGSAAEDPFVNVRDVLANPTVPIAGTQSNTQIPGINATPGLRSVGELLSVRNRANAEAMTGPLTFVSRWPSGQDPVNPRYNRWLAAPWNMDQLGFDVNFAGLAGPVASEQLNSSFAELDGSSGRSEMTYVTATSARQSWDDPYAGVSAATPAATSPRATLTQATRGTSNEYREKLIGVNNVINTVSTRSDVFAVWFTLAGFTQDDVQLDADEPLVPSVRRRFVMVVDRSNVVNQGEKPRILLLKEVPVQ